MLNSEKTLTTQTESNYDNNINPDRCNLLGFYFTIEIHFLNYSG